MTFPIAMLTKGARIVVTPNQSHVIVASRSKTIVVVSLKDLKSQTGFGPDGLCTLSEILSNKKIENSGVVNLTTAEWLGRWRQLRKSHPKHFVFP